MVNLNNNFEFDSQIEFDFLKFKFNKYSVKFESYVKEQQRNIDILRKYTGRSLGAVTSRDIKPTDKFIYQEELNLKNNQEKFSIIENKIMEIEKYINIIAYDDNFDKIMDIMSELNSSLVPFSNTDYPFPSKIPSSSPFVIHAIKMLYIQNRWINEEFLTLDAQRIRFSETVKIDIEQLNELQLPDCFAYEKESMLIERVAAMGSIESSYMGNDVMDSLSLTCDIYLGYQYCV